jgi:hypothetical protein
MKKMTVWSSKVKHSFFNKNEMGNEKLLLNKWLLVLFVIILFIGGFYRFYRLDTVPSIGLFGDEAFNGNDAIRTIRSNDFKLFYPENNGREPLFIWLTAAVHAILKPSVATLRLIPAIFGFLTIFFLPCCVIQLDKLLSRNKKSNQTKYIYIAAITSACFLAGSLWHINFSRIAFRAILDPFFAVVSILLLCTSIMKKENILLAIFTGFILGLGVYGYGSYKFLLPIVTIILFIGVKRYKSFKPIIYILISSFVVMFPLLRMIFMEPEMYFSRLSQVSVFGLENPVAEFLISLKKLILMFFSQGDLNSRHNFNGLPQLHVVALFFLIVELLYLSLTTIFTSMKSKTNKLKLSPSYFIDSSTGLLIFLWFCTMILPSALTWEGQPHALRAIGAVVPVMMLCGLGVSFVFYVFNQLIKNQFVKKTIIITISAIIFCTQLSVFENYFIQHAESVACQNAYQLKRNLNFKTFIQNKETSKLIITKNETNLAKIWDVQQLLYYMNCDLDSYNLTILSIKDTINIDIKSYELVLCPLSYRDDLNRLNILYY